MGLLNKFKLPVPKWYDLETYPHDINQQKNGTVYSPNIVVFREGDYSSKHHLTNSKYKTTIDGKKNQWIQQIDTGSDKPIHYKLLPANKLFCVAMIAKAAEWMKQPQAAKWQQQYSDQKFRNEYRNRVRAIFDI